MKNHISRWFGYCLDGLVLLTVAAWGLTGCGGWDLDLEAEVLNHD